MVAASSWWPLALTFTCVVVSVRGASVSGSGQTGLTEAEIALFGQISHDPSDEYIGSSSDGSSWQIASDGIVSYAEDSLFPGLGNPNSINEQSHFFEVPKVVTYLSSASCLPMGPIGVAIDGIPIYNPFTAEDTDAVENEVFDSCKGHPDPRGAYHYHQHPDCIQDRDKDTTPNQLIGVALDGIPIYGLYDENGQEVTSADIDDCHGGPLSSSDTRYVYRTTKAYPYVVGCFWGEVPGRVLTEGQSCKYAVATDTNGELGPGGQERPGDGTGGAGTSGTGNGGGRPPRPGGNGGGRPPPPGGEGGGRPLPPGGNGSGRPHPPGGEGGGRPPPPGADGGGRPPPPGGDGGNRSPPPGGNDGRRPPPPDGDGGGRPPPPGGDGGRRPPPAGGDRGDGGELLFPPGGDGGGLPFAPDEGNPDIVPPPRPGIRGGRRGGRRRRG